MVLPSLDPIGVVRSPYEDLSDAPRQPELGGDAAIIELFPDRLRSGVLEGLETFRYLWVLTWFHRSEAYKPMVVPPRAPKQKRGVFATRSPHRPIPIGLSVAAIDAIDGWSVRVSGCDLVDGTPVLDLKPYLAYADALPHAGNGWLDHGPDADLGEPFGEVLWSDDAALQAAWIRERSAFPLKRAVDRCLAAGREPHPYRRIQRKDGHLRLAIKAWRVLFTEEEGCAVVQRVHTGYRAAELDPGSELAQRSPAVFRLHAEFERAWPGAPSVERGASIKR